MIWLICAAVIVAGAAFLGWWWAAVVGVFLLGYFAGCLVTQERL